MAKLFSEQKGEIFNLSDIVLKGWLSSLMSTCTINAVTGTELALPSTSGKPTAPPRRIYTHAGTECHSTNNTGD